jgi:hypothetical protein
MKPNGLKSRIIGKFDWKFPKTPFSGNYGTPLVRQGD